MKINEMVEQAHKNAKEKGFWDDWRRIEELRLMPINISKDGQRQVEIDTNNAIATRLMLIVSEVSEALEALRKDDLDNFAEELADVVIRVCDLAGGLDIDLEKEIEKKMERNKARKMKGGESALLHTSKADKGN